MSKMAHQVTITRTTTTTSSTAILLNTGYLKTFPGFLKLAELVLGAVCVGLIGHRYSAYYHETPVIFFLLMATTFLIGTFCLLLSCIVSLATSSVISKTIYEVVYHVVAFGLYIAASISLLAHIQNRQRSYYYEEYMAASIIGLIVSGLYLFSTILAVRSYRGL